MVVAPAIADAVVVAAVGDVSGVALAVRLLDTVACAAVVSCVLFDECGDVGAPLDVAMEAETTIKMKNKNTTSFRQSGLTSSLDMDICSGRSIKGHQWNR